LQFRLKVSRFAFSVVYLSRVERAVTYVGLEIVEKLAAILEVDPAEFFRRPNRPRSRRKAD
jgi:hypothetical protein